MLPLLSWNKKTFFFFTVRWYILMEAGRDKWTIATSGLTGGCVPRWTGRTSRRPSSLSFFPAPPACVSRRGPWDSPRTTTPPSSDGPPWAGPWGNPSSGVDRTYSALPLRPVRALRRPRGKSLGGPGHLWPHGSQHTECNLQRYGWFHDATLKRPNVHVQRLSLMVVPSPGGTWWRIRPWASSIWPVRNTQPQPLSVVREPPASWGKPRLYVSQRTEAKERRKFSLSSEEQWRSLNWSSRRFFDTKRRISRDFSPWSRSS